jgi:hypothetical protein
VHAASVSSATAMTRDTTLEDYFSISMWKGLNRNNVPKLGRHRSEGDVQEKSNTLLRLKLTDSSSDRSSQIMLSDSHASAITIP